MRTVFPILALGIALGACGSGAATPDASTVDAVPRQVLAVAQPLPQGNEIEGSWTAGPHDSIGLSIMTSEGTIDFDIHGHANGGTQEITSAFGQALITYDFVPTQQAQWYLLLRNDTSDTITLNIDMNLFGAATWNGWQ
jgi:hypothetical protein